MAKTTYFKNESGQLVESKPVIEAATTKAYYKYELSAEIDQLDKKIASLQSDITDCETKKASLQDLLAKAIELGVES